MAKFGDIPTQWLVTAQAALASRNNTLLKTAGKHVRRAEANREEAPMSAAADYLRASRRTGLEKPIIEKYRAAATACMVEEFQLREQLAKEAAEREASARPGGDLFENDARQRANAGSKTVSANVRSRDPTRRRRSPFLARARGVGP